jgi:serine phosphatase RsbU (regulator of sigma subunit)
MLGGIANQAAIVIQSARLVQAQREEAYVSAALLQVAEAVSRSTDLDETMATVVRITPLLVGVEACALFVRDSASGAFLPFQQYGLRGEDRSAFRAMRLAESDPLVRKLAAGSPFVDPQSLPGASELTQRWGGDSLLVWPLAAKGEVLGMMAVDVPGSAQRFTQRWMNILSGIAGQAAIAVENHRLMQEAAEQERLKQELAVAHQIQVSFLPESCPEMPGWDLWSIWRSARQVGGDFYDFIPLPPGTGQPTVAGRLGLVIADVADKGVPAALFMALSRTLMRTMASDGRSPADAAARANDLIVADARSDLFVTLFYAILEPDSGQVTYVSAGHVPPLVVRHEDGGVEELRHPSLPLGIMAGVRYEERRFELNPGDSLVLYTDGVTEAVGGSKEMYGPERLSQVLTSHRHKPARKLAAAVDHSVSAFVGEAAQFDDFTLVVAKYTG